MVLAGKIHSNSNKSTEFNLTDGLVNIDYEKISGFVTAIYDDFWWLGCVLGKNDESQEVTISFLHPSGPSPSFFYPNKPDVLNVNPRTVLLKVNPVTETGRVYKLSEAEMSLSQSALKMYK